MEVDDEAVDERADAVTVCGRPECPLGPPVETVAPNKCQQGRWPNGVIPYEFVTKSNPPSSWSQYDKDRIREIMNDWERITRSYITFVPATSGVRIKLVLGGGESVSYEGCRDQNVCEVGLQWHFNAYHELGHAIGLNIHHWQRHDAPHYFEHHVCDGQGICGIQTSDNLSDFGPFDYKSTMLYKAFHPSHTRWDGSPIVEGGVCDQIGPLTDPPGCPGGSHCPTCTDCGQGVLQPMGFPTKGDASAVVELYQEQADAGWRKFLRTVEEDTSAAGSQRPFAYRLSSTDVIPATASPALETWGGDELAIYVRGVSSTGVSRIWAKYLELGAWSNWTMLGRPPSSSGVVLSDPAVVSWAPGRTDLVVTLGNTVYIRTYRNDAWSAWGSLGNPPSLAESAPAIASWGPNRLDVFVRGGNDRLYQKRCTANCLGNAGTWSGWMVVSTGTFRGKPAAVATAAGIDVFVHGLDGTLYGVATADGQNWQDFDQVNSEPLQWNPSCPVPAFYYDSCAPDSYSPAASSRRKATGSLRWEVFVRGREDQVLVSTYASGWGPYQSIGGVLTSSPASIAQGLTDNRIDVVSNMTEETSTGNHEVGVWWKHYASAL